jgi:hypothetical protein
MITIIRNNMKVLGKNVSYLETKIFFHTWLVLNNTCTNIFKYRIFIKYSVHFYTLKMMLKYSCALYMEGSRERV